MSRSLFAFSMLLSISAITATGPSTATASCTPVSLGSSTNNCVAELIHNLCATTEPTKSFISCDGAEASRVNMGTTAAQAITALQAALRAAELHEPVCESRGVGSCSLITICFFNASGVSSLPLCLRSAASFVGYSASVLALVAAAAFLI